MSRGFDRDCGEHRRPEQSTLMISCMHETLLMAFRSEGLLVSEGKEELNRALANVF